MWRCEAAFSLSRVVRLLRASGAERAVDTDTDAGAGAGVDHDCNGERGVRFTDDVDGIGGAAWRGEGGMLAVANEARRRFAARRGAYRRRGYGPCFLLLR